MQASIQPQVVHCLPYTWEHEQQCTDCGKGSLIYRVELRKQSGDREILKISLESLSPESSSLADLYAFVCLFGTLGFCFCLCFPTAVHCLSCSNTPCKSFPNQKHRDSKAHTELPHSQDGPFSLECDIWQKYYIITVNSSMRVSPHGANSALSGLTVTLWTIWQLVLMLNKCLPNTMERIYFHWHAVLMDLWNESHCIAAFLRQVLYLINAVHKLYNYIPICHCQIYTLLHTVRLR